MLEPLTEKYRWEMHVTIYDSDARKWTIITIKILNEIFFYCQLLILTLHPLLTFTLVRLASHSQVRWPRCCINLIKSLAESQILHYRTDAPVTTVHLTATATNWPPFGTLCGLSGPSSGLNTAGPQLSRRGSVAIRHRTERGSLSWSAALLGTGRYRGRCPPENTNSPRKQPQQTRHLVVMCRLTLTASTWSRVLWSWRGSSDHILWTWAGCCRR